MSFPPAARPPSVVARSRRCPDGQRDRLVVDPGQQILQLRAVRPGRAVPDSGQRVRVVTPAVDDQVRDRLGPPVPEGEPLAGWDAGGPGNDPALLLALGVAGRRRMAGRRVRPGGQFGPQPVIDAEQ